MSRDVVQMLCAMDTGRVETRLVLQCAPLIVGLKISNMCIMPNHQLYRAWKLLGRGRLCHYVFCMDESKSMVLFYDKKELQQYLLRADVWCFMSDCGYPTVFLDDVLRNFRRRYREYLMGEQEFPHEMGILLGYPLEDVNGFIQNKGENYLCSGYWKVYYDMSAKRKLFRMFELAKETLIELMSNGVALEEIIDTYGGNVL